MQSAVPVSMVVNGEETLFLSQRLSLMAFINIYLILHFDGRKDEG
jgi:hypothetical protein